MPTGVNDDSWAILLIATGYLQDVHPPANFTDPAIPSVLVCPEVNSVLFTGHLSTIGTVPSNLNAMDGFERRESKFVKAGLIADIGYGINGTTHINLVSAGSDSSAFKYLPSNSIIRAGASTPAGHLKKFADFHDTSNMVLFFDGIEWNPELTPSANAPQYQGSAGCSRITGARHGKFDPNNFYGTGLVNILCIDGHAAATPRADCPGTASEFTGASATPIRR